jgi:hypothetical protein
MDLKRTAVLGVLGAGFAAMLAGAMTTGQREIAAPPSTGGAAVERKGEALGAEIARLRARLRPSVEPQQPSRNLFEYGSKATPRSESPSDRLADRTADEAPQPVIQALPPLRLVGLAEDPGPDGPVRTAFISGAGDLYLAKQGDVLAARYEVTQISGAGVVLTDLTTQTTINLALK